MFLKWLRKDEQGSVMVIVAIAMVALMGFAGIAVDYGSMAMTKQELQNAADAAALAGGQDLMNNQASQIVATANSYIQANGFTPGDGVTISDISYTSDKVTVEIQTQQKVALSGVLTGKNTTTISVRAVAEVTSAVGSFPYALFADATAEENGDGLSMNAHTTVNGNMHSNAGISMKHTQVNGKATVPDGESISIKNPENGAKTMVIEMPRTDGLINFIKNSSPYTVNGNYDGTLQDLVETAKAHKVNGVVQIYITGNASFGGESQNDKYPVNVLVAGDIIFHGTALGSDEDTPVVIISEHGNFTQNGQGTKGEKFYALMLAPEGDVTLNGNDFNLYGGIIAQSITKHGGKTTVTYSAIVDDFLPGGKVRLIE